MDVSKLILILNDIYILLYNNRLVKLIVYLILGTHVISCIWYLIACTCLHEYDCCKERSWFEDFRIDNMEPLGMCVLYHVLITLYVNLEWKIVATVWEKMTSWRYFNCHYFLIPEIWYTFYSQNFIAYVYVQTLYLLHASYIVCRL